MFRSCSREGRARRGELTFGNIPRFGRRASAIFCLNSSLFGRGEFARCGGKLYFRDVVRASELSTVPERCSMLDKLAFLELGSSKLRPCRLERSFSDPPLRAHCGLAGKYFGKRRLCLTRCRFRGREFGCNTGCMRFGILEPLSDRCAFALKLLKCSRRIALQRLLALNV